jgi:hypothetical protein
MKPAQAFPIITLQAARIRSSRWQAEESHSDTRTRGFDQPVTTHGPGRGHRCIENYNFEVRSTISEKGAA